MLVGRLGILDRHARKDACLADGMEECLDAWDSRAECRECTGKGVGRQGVGSFCEELLRFNPMPFRQKPLLVHFRVYLYVYVSLSLSLYIYIYTCIDISLSLCIYIYIYIYIY